MQIEKSEPEGNRIKPKTRFTEFSALSVDARVGISRSASETDDWLFFLPIIEYNHIISDGQMIKKGCMQWNPVYGWEDFASSATRTRDH